MGKREELRKKRQREQQRRKIFWGIGIGAFLGLIIFLALPSVLTVVNKEYIKDIIIPEPVFRPMVMDNAMGDPEAPVRVVNISNYKCGHCETFAMEEDPSVLGEAMILEEYVDTGKVQFVYLPYSWSPDDKFSPEAATYCAMEQGRFWDYRDLIFTNVNNAKLPGLTKDVLIEFADLLNLDVPAFKKCFNDGSHVQQVKDDIEYARGIGLEGTPSFLVNDQLVFRNVLVDTIEAELGGGTGGAEIDSETEEDSAETSSSLSTDNLIIPPPMDWPQPDGLALGDPNAPVYVESYSNYNCGYCEQFIKEKRENVLSETGIIEDYIASGMAYLVYVPVSWYPDTTFSAEEAAYCAMDQNRFWDFRDLVFYNLDNTAIGGINQDSLTLMAESLGLDMPTFNDCFESHKYLQRVTDDVAYARDAGMTGTPTFSVDGEIVNRGVLGATIEDAFASAGMKTIVEEKGYTDIILPDLISRPGVDGNTMGSANASVRVINFSNYNCGHCETFALDENLEAVTEARLLKDYIRPGKIEFVYLPYTWTPEMEFSPEEAAYCAMDQGKFWEYRDMIFLNHGNKAIGDITKENLYKFAEILELDMDSFGTCFEDLTYHQKVIDDREFSLSIGLEGTPSFLVNESLVFRSDLIETIETELAAAGATGVEPTEEPEKTTEDSQPIPESVSLDDILLPAEHERPNVDGNTMGNTDAPVKIEYISNFLCGNCSQFILDTNTENINEMKILEDYIRSGDVRYTYVPFSWTPEEYFSPEEATYCAMEQDKFWEYRDLVHRNKNNDAIGGLNKTSLIAFAELLELDMNAFNTCFESFKYHQQVLDNVTYAGEIGPINTLYFYVNGEVIHSTALEDLITRIDSELAAAN